MDPITLQPPQGKVPMDSAGPRQVPEPKHFLNKKFAITLVILLLLGIGAYAGIWVWQNQQSAQEVVPTFTPRADATANWKTYTNTQYGGSFKIPTQWTFIVQSQEQNLYSGEFINQSDFVKVSSDPQFKNNPLLSIIGKVPYVSLTINTNTWVKGTTDWQVYLKQPAGGPQGQQVPISLNSFEKIGDSGYLYSNSLSRVGVLWVKNDILWQLETDQTEIFTTKEELKNILSTFKFTNQGPIACTQEAKQCSDGSYVSRTGPNCEFTACPGDGTLTGHVTIGPNCPVEQVGNPCTPTPQAYTSRQVMVYKTDGTTLVTTQNFDTQRNYNIALPAGTYVVKSRTNIGTTLNIVGTVTIKNGQTATLNFSIDTGIR